MLPAFQENGLLPAGVHHSDLSGFEEAFAWNAHRRRIYAQMQHGLAALHAAGYRLLVVGENSFPVTSCRANSSCSSTATRFQSSRWTPGSAILTKIRAC